MALAGFPRLGSMHSHGWFTEKAVDGLDLARENLLFSVLNFSEQGIWQLI